MAVRDFFKKVFDYGIKEGYFHLKKINEIEKSCCNTAITEVIDFDKAKDKIASDCKLKPPKSCDAIKFLVKEERIDFIEFKGWQKFIEFQKKKLNPTGIEEQINNFSLVDKIIDSYYALNTILSRSNFDWTIREKVLFRNLKFNFIILVDLEIENDPIKKLAVTLDYLSETSSSIENIITDKLDDHISKLDIPFSFFSKPILLSCSNIDNFYSKL